jgi:valyl-tRNA synthetase
MELKMDKIYDPKSNEDRIYKSWIDQGCFHEEPDPEREPFCIVIPPPNITGKLHMGHGLDNTMQDAIIRYKRMMGFCTLWLPGTDHASIATEVKIVDAMAEEGLKKEDLGREKFLERAWQWREDYGRTIVDQLKKLGSSCDWSRERFTMDEGLSAAVTEVFNRQYEKGLIYRGARMINWCPDCMTALSDAEVEYEEQDSHFWNIKYPLTDGSGEVIVATTRPETMLGDTAVAVNPDDERYAGMIGKTIMLPIMNREIPIIADSYVDMEFGTGAVKITPAHDPNDYEMGERHDLEFINIMNEDGTLNQNAGKYNGVDGLLARQQIVDELKEAGLLIKIEDHSHNVGLCYRCDHVVEPLISEQWFVKMDDLAKPAIDIVENGEIQFVPDRFEKIYYNWMYNIRDWCISRQLWWGHRIPAWYCNDCGEMIVARTAPDKCPKCSSTNLRQDEDVLDTWFSSALWPFSTLGWPDKTPELDYFYPTDVLVTSYDIIFFWVARMIFSGLEQMEEKPFSHVLIHGLVRDEQGRKMSKSLGNGIDPLDIIDRFGADALRFSLVIGTSPGNDMRFSDEKAESSRNFANKVWNASRFVISNLGEDTPMEVKDAKLNLADEWILTRLNLVTSDVIRHMDAYDLGLACTKVHDFIRSEFCDWYIEFAKQPMYNGADEQKASTRAVLAHVLKASLKLLHPFMPFVTEAIWEHIPGTGGFLMMQDFPAYDEAYVREESSQKIENVMEIIHSIRNIRAEMNVQTGKKTSVIMQPSEGVDYLFECVPYIKSLASCDKAEFTDEFTSDEKMVSAQCLAAQVFIPLGDLVDMEKEAARIKKEIEKAESEIKRSNGKLANKGFTEKAPAAVVERERENLANNEKLLADLKERLISIQQ